MMQHHESMLQSTLSTYSTQAQVPYVCLPTSKALSWVLKASEHLGDYHLSMVTCSNTEFRLGQVWLGGTSESCEWQIRQIE